MMKASYELRRTEPTKPEKNPIERIGDQHALMMRYVEDLAQSERKPGALEHLDPRIIYPEDYEGMAFKPDLYVIEPVVIDDLEEAKKKHDESRVENLRSIIRAMSWMSHGRTDDAVAAKLASEFLHQADTRETQRGFDYSQTEVAEWTRVLNALRKGAQTKPAPCGDSVEEPLRFVESEIVKAWKQLISNKKKNKSDWPTTYPVTEDPPILSESVRRSADRLTNLRHIRDQLYFWRLYPKHCMYARGK